MIRLHRLTTPDLEVYKVTARRIPRGFVQKVREVVCHKSGDGRYELAVDYRYEDRWIASSLQGRRIDRTFETRDEAVHALLTYQEFTRPFRRPREPGPKYIRSYVQEKV